jgi:hypothetical protein
MPQTIPDRSWLTMFCLAGHGSPLLRFTILHTEVGITLVHLTPPRCCGLCLLGLHKSILLNRAKYASHEKVVLARFGHAGMGPGSFRRILSSTLAIYLLNIICEFCTKPHLTLPTSENPNCYSYFLPIRALRIMAITAQ